MGSLTLHGGRALAVVEDGQLAEHVPRTERAEPPAVLAHAELPLCRDTNRAAGVAHAHVWQPGTRRQPRWLRGRM